MPEDYSKEIAAIFDNIRAVKKGEHDFLLINQKAAELIMAVLDDLENEVRELRAFKQHWEDYPERW